MENLESGNVSIENASQATDMPNGGVNYQQQQPVGQPQERTYSQHEVNQMVSGAKLKAAEKAKNEAYKEFQSQYQNQPNFTQSGTQSAGQNMQQNAGYQSAPQSLNESDIDRIVSQRLQQKEQEILAQQAHEKSQALATEIDVKITGAAEKYPDMQNLLMNNLNPARVPDIYLLANKFGNTADVLYSLAKNPTEATKILGTLKELGPQAAEYAMKEFSESLHQINNAQDMFAKVVPEPSSTLRQTTTGFANKDPGLRDIKAKYRF